MIRRILLALILLAATACEPYIRIDQPQVLTAPAANDRVLLVGDSITSIQFGAGDEIQAAIAGTPNWWMSLNAIGLWTINQGRTVVTDAYSNPSYYPKAMVVHIGTNDTAWCEDVGCNPSLVADNFRGLVETAHNLKPSTCIVGMKIFYSPPGYQMVNQTIDILHAEGKVDVVLDWPSSVLPQWLTDPYGHLTQPGQDVMAAAIVNSLGSCPA